MIPDRNTAKTEICVSRNILYMRSFYFFTGFIEPYSVKAEPSYNGILSEM